MPSTEVDATPPGDAAAPDELGRLGAEIAELCRDELGLPAYGLDMSFFGAGGDSMAATRLLVRLAERFGRRIALAEMYTATTPAQLAGLLAGRPAPGRPPRSITSLARRRRDGAPLSYNQLTFYEMDRATAGAGLFNNVCHIRVTGAVDPAALAGAITDAVRRQPALRTVFGESGGGPVQRIVDTPPRVDRIRVAGGPDAVEPLIRRQHLTGFDLHAAPPVRFVLADRGTDGWDVVCTVHHVIFDGMSQGVLVDEIAHAYAVRTGTAQARPALGSDYCQFAEWQRDTLRGDRLEAHLDALQETLARRVTPLATESGPAADFTARTRPYGLDAPVVDGLEAAAAAGESTVFVAMVGALLDFAARRVGGGQLVAVQAANRSWPGSDGMVGLFSNTLLLPGRLAAEAGTAAAVAEARDGMATALAREELPLDHALRILAGRGVEVDDVGRRPQLGFAFQPPRSHRRRIAGAEFGAEFLLRTGDTVDPTTIPLVLELFGAADGVRGVLHHRPAAWPGDRYASAERELTEAFDRLAGAGPDRLPTER